MLALVAAIAGFGRVSLGDALSTFYAAAGEAFDPGAQFPSQCDADAIEVSAMSGDTTGG